MGHLALQDVCKQAVIEKKEEKLNLERIRIDPKDHVSKFRSDHFQGRYRSVQEGFFLTWFSYEGNYSFKTIYEAPNLIKEKAPHPK